MWQNYCCKVFGRGCFPLALCSYNLIKVSGGRVYWVVTVGVYGMLKTVSNVMSTPPQIRVGVSGEIHTWPFCAGRSVAYFLRGEYTTRSVLYHSFLGG